MLSYWVSFSFSPSVGDDDFFFGGGPAPDSRTGDTAGQKSRTLNGRIQVSRKLVVSLPRLAFCISKVYRCTVVQLLFLLHGFSLLIVKQRNHREGNDHRDHQLSLYIELLGDRHLGQEQSSSWHNKVIFLKRENKSLLELPNNMAFAVGPLSVGANAQS